MMKKRCPWCLSDPLYIAYHDNEWGRPCFDDHALFAMLCLEIMQAGLSWLTILKRRKHLHFAFDNFDPKKVAQYSDDDVARLMANPNIIRHRKKILAIINNANAFLELSKTQRFSDYLWQMVGNRPIINHPKTTDDVPSHSHLSAKLASSLKEHGFCFIGATTCYAFMQAAGLVNDHLADCDYRLTNHSRYLTKHSH